MPRLRYDELHGKFLSGTSATDHEWNDLGSLTPKLYLITQLLVETGATPPAKPLTQ